MKPKYSQTNKNCISGAKGLSYLQVSYHRVGEYEPLDWRYLFIVEIGIV